MIFLKVRLQLRDSSFFFTAISVYHTLKISFRLANEHQMKEIQSKIREIQKENDEVVSKLAKKEHECEVKIEEKEELMQTLNKIKSKLDKEAESHAEAKNRLAEMRQQVEDLNQLVSLLLSF